MALNIKTNHRIDEALSENASRKTYLKTAYGRIVTTTNALRSTSSAKCTIHLNAELAMLTQNNASADTALALLH